MVAEKLEDFTIDYFEEIGVEYIQYQFTTIFGVLKEVEFPVKIWDEMKEGTGVDGSSLGFLKTSQSDMQAIPDYKTFAILPWDTRVGRFICDLTDNEGNAFPTCPRGILKKIISKAKDMGFLFKTRPELEVYFLSDELEPADDGDYMCTPPKDSLHELRRLITDDLIEMNIGIKTIHHEVGPAQHEVEFTADDAIYSADNVQTAKQLFKMNAIDQDIICTFMPKPFREKAGSGLHIHQYLTDLEGNNVFSDKEKGLSDILRWYVGGLEKHAPAISAILNPATNSYKRLVPNHEAPVHIAWGVGNRTALIRVPGYEKSARIEYRAGDGSMNIYLGFAALLAAGLDGIKNKIEPNKPTKDNVDLLTESERKELGIEQLPWSLKRALIYFETDPLMNDIFGEDFIGIFLEKKKKELTELEIAQKNGFESDWEFNAYLDC
ncbi:glutamine synthetase family protein [Promethearchaeum syntrophicum]|uniref:Glutamine synthetase family protein n=1 Tax=Promethearchaeum syntrophicum TaxID=2594042 RepID=A0A5B9DFK4_9ARCH|nr:glutamine synthetase family protein [Candidatus Prometheoarchaeum syntrophicum]QEE17902.1 Glutamine synthetase [Candidatus Prometheoarchaeum syntrophicum]